MHNQKLETLYHETHHFVFWNIFITHIIMILSYHKKCNLLKVAAVAILKICQWIPLILFLSVHVICHIWNASSTQLYQIRFMLQTTLCIRLSSPQHEFDFLLTCFAEFVQMKKHIYLSVNTDFSWGLHVVKGISNLVSSRYYQWFIFYENPQEINTRSRNAM